VLGVFGGVGVFGWLVQILLCTTELFKKDCLYTNRTF